MFLFMLCSNHVVCQLVSPDLLSPLVPPRALYAISGMQTFWDPENIMCIYSRRSVQSTRVSHAPKSPFSLSPETGFPLNNVRVRGQTDPYMQHKRDGVPTWKETKAVATAFSWDWPLRTIIPGGQGIGLGSRTLERAGR